MIVYCDTQELCACKCWLLPSRNPCD